MVLRLVYCSDRKNPPIPKIASIQASGVPGYGERIPHGTNANVVPLVPHQQSVTVGPTTYVISVNAKNRNGYPTREVLRRLKSSGADIYRTDRDGAITCRSDGSFIYVETDRR